MRLFSDSSFLAAARVEISEQISTCADNLKDLGKMVESADISSFNEEQENLLNEVNLGINQIKTLFDNSNLMMANIEDYLVNGTFPTSEEMKKSIINSHADANALDLIDDYKELSDEDKEKFAFVACNYELVSTMLENAIELCAVLHKAAKRF